jgi:hypothetical protein
MDTFFPMPEQLDVVAAYGKQFPTNAAAKQHWLDGKDFAMFPGGAPYFSIRDSATLKSNGVKSVMIWRGKREGIEVEL